MANDDVIRCSLFGEMMHIIRQNASNYHVK